MRGLKQMSAAELKALAKEKHVKEWWNMNKPTLILELTKLESQTKKPNLHIKELTYAGKTQTIREWATELNMPWATLYDRVNRNGWTVEEALTIPLGERRKRK